jgi:anaphase-promoting complex subunit 1
VEKQQSATAEGGKGRKDKGKGKKTASGRGKKKVSMGAALHEEAEKKADDVGPVEAAWWLRDSAIDELKGKTWLARREG